MPVDPNIKIIKNPDAPGYMALDGETGQLVTLIFCPPSVDSEASARAVYASLFEPMPADVILATAREQARDVIVAHIDNASDAAAKGMSRCEREDGPAKLAAALAYKAGKATLEQAACLDAEATRMAETTGALADKIIANAAKAVSPALAAATRRKAFKDIDAARSVVTVEKAVDAAMKAFDLEMKAKGF